MLELYYKEKFMLPDVDDATRKVILTKSFSLKYTTFHLAIINHPLYAFAWCKRLRSTCSCICKRFTNTAPAHSQPSY